MSDSVGPFVNDEYLQKLVLYLLQSGCTDFVETGTFRGDTCNWVANNSDKPVYSCEINPNIVAQPNPRVIHWRMSSETFLRLVRIDLGEQPLFFLDAHWLDYWPLRDEIEAIGKSYQQAVIIIHDFVVPGKSNFATSAGGGGEPRIEHHRDTSKDELPTLDYIKPYFNPSRQYEWLYPSYDGKHPGYIVLFQNVSPRGMEYLDGRVV